MVGNNQQNLFETDPPPWEIDDAGHQLVATIVLSEGPTGAFDYLVPESCRDETKAGRRVRVPFGRGNRTVVGYCVEVETKATGSRRLKSIRSVVDTTTLVSPAMLRLTRWIADYYLASWGQVLEAVVPQAVRAQAGTRATTFLSLAPEVELRLSGLKLPAKQLEVVHFLIQSGQPVAQSQVAASVGCTTAPIRALRDKGLIQSATRRVHQLEPEEAAPSREADLELNTAQRAALDAILRTIQSQQHKAILLHGITGSGKTEVYIQAIREVVRFGRQAIVLVPEISLTPQTRQRFRSRFDQVAVLHSHMSHVERHWQWSRIVRGEVQVVVGARSAIFAPTPHLGLIVLDEEHDTSFKQDKVPRYHAKDVAVERARMENIPLVLGSATPSLESWHSGRTGQYELVRMPHRVLGRPLPDVQTVDMRVEAQYRYSRGALSRRLCQSVDAALKDQSQVILLLNRRGFSTHIQCRSCGVVVRCPHCEVALTHHRDGERVVCHYCDYVDDAPSNCPSCQSTAIRYSGLGTQKLESEVRARFAGASCLRMDSDAMRKHGSHEEALTRFREGEIQVLIGTQMIAKGLDFPNVTLVGVVNADTALHFPDFRASERTFQLVTQVAGRTGRGAKRGLVLVQTFQPDHFAIHCAARHDYESFANEELMARQELNYPPWTATVRVVVRSGAELKAKQFAEQVAERMQREAFNQQAKIDILGPAAAPLAKLRDKYRFHLLFRSAYRDALRSVVSRVSQAVKAPGDVQWIVDVDPMDML